MSGNGDKDTGNRSALARFFGPELRVWRDKSSLWIAFWGYGVVVSLVIVVLFATAYGLSQIVFQQVLIVISLLYTAWNLVGIWRCAANAAPFWADLARLLTVAWALNVCLVLLFLQIDLLARFVQG